MLICHKVYEQIDDEAVARSQVAAGLALGWKTKQEFDGSRLPALELLYTQVNRIAYGTTMKTVYPSRAGTAPKACPIS
jgi:hypothetical protein